MGSLQFTILISSVISNIIFYFFGWGHRERCNIYICLVVRKLPSLPMSCFGTFTTMLTHPQQDEPVSILAPSGIKFQMQYFYSFHSLLAQRKLWHNLHPEKVNNLSFFTSSFTVTHLMIFCTILYQIKLHYIVSSKDSNKWCALYDFFPASNMTCIKNKCSLEEYIGNCAVQHQYWNAPIELFQLSH